MTRVTLTDGSGHWFDTSAAQRFEEDTQWNGSNHISMATGSQWFHQTLYYTKGGRWIVYETSQWQGVLDTWEEVDVATAAKWLAVNGHEPPAAAAEAFAALEIS